MNVLKNSCILKYSFLSLQTLKLHQKTCVFGKLVNFALFLALNDETPDMNNLLYWLTTENDSLLCVLRFSGPSKRLQILLTFAETGELQLLLLIRQLE